MGERIIPTGFLPREVKAAPDTAEKLGVDQGQNVPYWQVVMVHRAPVRTEGVVGLANQQVIEGTVKSNLAVSVTKDSPVAPVEPFDNSCLYIG